jgi:hypothetical protein
MYNGIVHDSIWLISAKESHTRSSQKEAALPAKGSNSTAAKDKTLIKHQEHNRQCKQVDQATTPMKLVPPQLQCANILDAARAAAREQL